jgi:hypothetical protein
MENTLVNAMGGRDLDLVVVSDGEAILGPSSVAGSVHDPILIALLNPLDRNDTPSIMM